MVTDRPEVEVFSTPTCPWCAIARRYLVAHGVPFLDADVSQDRHALRRMVEATGQYGVPVVRVGAEYLLGWDPEEFERVYGP